MMSETTLKAIKAANEMILKAVETGDVDELFSYGYQHGIDMYEIWDDTDTYMIGFGVEDDTYYFKQED